MKNIKKLIKDKRGMTLVEISLGFLLLAVVMSMSLTVLMFTSNMFARSAKLNINKMSGDEIFRMVENKLIYATHIEVLPEGSSIASAKYENIISVDSNGRICTGTKTAGITQAYADNVYDGSKITLTSDKKSDSLLGLTLQLAANGEQQYKTESAMRILSFVGAPAGVTLGIESANATYENPVISYDNVMPFSMSDAYLGGPYTVDQKYVPEGTVEDFNYGTSYPQGSYVYYNGQLYYQSYPANLFGTVPGNNGHWWINVTDDLRDTDSTYTKTDVIISNGKYYMCARNNPASDHDPSNYLIMYQFWTQVYWFDDYAEEDHREYGWSIKEDKYLRAVDSPFLGGANWMGNGFAEA